MSLSAGSPFPGENGFQENELECKAPISARTLIIFLLLEYYIFQHETRSFMSCHFSLLNKNPLAPRDLCSCKSLQHGIKSEELKNRQQSSVISQ